MTFRDWRRASARALVFALALFAAGRTTLADAQAEPTEVPAELMTLLRAGVDARTRGDDVEAGRLFAEVCARDPALGRAHAQLGLVHQALREWVSAADELRAGLADDDPWIERHRVELVAALGEVSSHLALLRVSSVDGAELQIDGQGAYTVLPIELTLVEGSHVLHVRADGFSPDDRVVSLVGGAPMDVEVSLVPSAASQVDPLPATPIASAMPDPHPLVWVGLASSLVALAGLVPTAIVAGEREATARARLAGDSCASTRPCELADAIAYNVDLDQYEVAVNSLWGGLALSGLLSTIGIGLTLGSAPRPVVVTASARSIQLLWTW